MNFEHIKNIPIRARADTRSAKKQAQLFRTTFIIRIACYLLLSNNFVKGVQSGLKLPSILGGALSVWRVTCLVWEVL